VLFNRASPSCGLITSRSTQLGRSKLREGSTPLLPSFCTMAALILLTRSKPRKVRCSQVSASERNSHPLSRPSSKAASSSKSWICSNERVLRPQRRPRSSAPGAQKNAGATVITTSGRQLIWERSGPMLERAKLAR